MFFSVISISGPGVPAVKADEDILQVALDIVRKVTNVKLCPDEIRNVHRMGPKILLEFLHAGTLSPIVKILDRKHHQAMVKEKTWLNVHMHPHDARLFYLARQLKRANLVDSASSTMNAVTRVTIRGVRHLIHTEKDLQKLISVPLSSFEKKRDAPFNDSAISL